jgi:hypothetical protein
VLDNLSNTYYTQCCDDRNCSIARSRPRSLFRDRDRSRVTNRAIRFAILIFKDE